MITDGAAEYYSAKDLLEWHACAHSAALSLRLPTDRRLQEYLRSMSEEISYLRIDEADDETYASPAALRGELHERSLLDVLEEEGMDVVRIERPSDYSVDALREAAAKTAQAMAEGAEVIHQAALIDGPWFGYADFLVRDDQTKSRLGAYAYSIRDGKLARKPASDGLIQLAHYATIVESIQGVPVPDLALWLGNGSLYHWDFQDALPYLDELRRRFLQSRAEWGPTSPEPVDACGQCRWKGLCEQDWGPQDLLHVHRMNRHQRRRLIDAGIDSVPRLAAANDHERPARMSSTAFDALVRQALVQIGAEPYVIKRPQPQATSLRSVPAPHELDVYLDLEGDPYAADPNLDYLFGYVTSSGAYWHMWAHNPDEERRALASFLEEMHGREVEGGDWHIYHYGHYEITSLRRIAGSHPDEDESIRLLEEVNHFVDNRFVDLYRTVEDSLWLQSGTTSLKAVEMVAGYDRHAHSAADSVAKADESIVEYERFLFSTDTAERSAILEGIRRYNEHDVLATRAVHHFLYKLRDEVAPADVVPEAEPKPPNPRTVERSNRTADMAKRLREAAAGDTVASGLSSEQTVTLAHMLDWHRAESAAKFAERKRLEEWALGGGEPSNEGDFVERLDALLNGASASSSRGRGASAQDSVLLNLEFVKSLGPKSRRKDAANVWVYTCDPGAWKIRKGSSVIEALPEGSAETPKRLSVEWIDPVAGEVHFSQQADPGDLGPLVLDEMHNEGPLWESLMRLAESVLSDRPSSEHASAIALLDRIPILPFADMARREDESSADQALRIAASADRGLLAIQGPPGTGKTWTGSQIIADKIAGASSAGRPFTVCITANGHRVIRHLMLEVMKRCEEQGLIATFAHVGGQDKVEAHPGIASLKDSKDLAPWVNRARAEGKVVVVGATKYALARPDAALIADMIVVDEASQYSLTDACAVAQAAPMVVALGDPQQLPSPFQASHDDSVAMSLLEHVADGSPVIPEGAGVFLDRSHRLHPAICSVVADLSYEGQLTWSDEAASRTISGASALVAGQTVEVRPGVSWVPLSDEHDEVDVVRELLEQMVGKTLVVKEDGSQEPLTWDEVRVVAPHNAHVNRLIAALPKEARVGTVDRFQGQEGHMVVYSMGRLAESSREVSFLYDTNRLNVALSRARLLAIVVSHEDAVFPPVTNPEHLRSVSQFIRAVTER